MADNVVLNAGAGGATCATDDVAGVQFQKVKLDVGGDGLSVPVVGALPVSAAALPLPAGAATEATLNALGAVESAAEVHLGSIDDKITAVNTGAVTVASSALPTGAATEATLATLNGKIPASPATEGGNLASIKTNTDKIPAQGQALMAASVPVAIASNQSAVPVSAAALPLPAGAATSALQGGGLPAALGAGGGIKVDGSGTALPVSVPADPFGVNADAIVAAGAAGSMQAKLRRMTQGLEDLKTLLVLAAGANLIGDVALQPRAAGGAQSFTLISAATMNDTSITDGVSNLLGGWITNINAAVRYVKFYDKATAPDPSADSALIKLTLAIPGNTAGAGGIFNIPSGINFANGIGIVIVTGVAANNEDAVAANEIVVNLWYKH